MLMLASHDQELLARNKYLAAETRILKVQLNGRLKLSATERGVLGEIASLLPASSMARGRVEARADHELSERSSN